MIKKFILFALMAATSLCFSSCLNTEEEDSDPTGYVSGYYTISGSLSSGYTLYQDGGGIVKLSNANVNEVTNGAGFKGQERAAMVLSYTQSNIIEQDGGKTIQNAEIYSGQFVKTVRPATWAEAEAKNITSSDSIFSISSIKNAWCYRGFLTTVFSANYSYKNSVAISPTCTIVYNESDKEVNNQLDITILYNRHTEKNAGYDYAGEIVHSYPLESLQGLLTGSSDSIDIVIHVEGSDVLKFKAAREDFRKGNYIPYK